MTFKFSVKKDKKSFYNNPSMVGEIVAKEMLDLLEDVIKNHSKTKLQKQIIKNSINFDANSWHYFAGGSGYIDKKFIRNFKMVLKNADKLNAYHLLHRLQIRSGQLKTPLHHALECLAYDNDKKAYQEAYVRDFGFYGLSKEDALNRLDSYIKKLKGKNQ